VRPLLFSFALLSGCALHPPAPTERPLGPGEVRSAVAVEEKLVVGETSKSDVRAAIGPATAVDFASGYEVWVYRQPPREKPPAPGAELVLLFDPGGLLAKTRVAPRP
jgi:hypothetical protein